MTFLQRDIIASRSITGWETWRPIYLQDDQILYHAVLFHKSLLENALHDQTKYGRVTEAEHRDYIIFSICLDTGVLPITTLQAEEMLLATRMPYNISQMLNACAKIIDDLFDEAPLFDVWIATKRLQFSFLSQSKVAAIRKGKIRRRPTTASRNK